MATSLLKFSLKTNLIKSIISEIVSNVSRYYYTFGRSGPWSNDNTPEAVSDSFEYENEARNEILLYKQIDANDVCSIIPRIDWVAGYTFDMYDEYSSDNPAFSGATALENAEFYCLTDDFNVYKCLYNNENKPSSIRPEGTSTTPIILEDGYIWKYMYTIPLSVRNKFLTATTMPVITALSNQFYSKGSIVSYNIENPGKKYPQASYKIVGLKIIDAGSGYSSAPTITIAAPSSTSGSGTTATVALVTIDGGVVTSATVGIQGSGYRYQPTITVTGGGATRQAVFEPILERLGDVYTILKVTGDGYLEENPYEVQSIQIVSGGSGYASGSLFFKDPDLSNGIKPVATAVVGDIQVGTSTQYTTLTGGTVIEGTFTQLIYPNQYVKVVNITSTATATTSIDAEGAVTGATIVTSGSGYITTPTVTISAPTSGTTATATATITNNMLSAITITNGGSGYTTSPTITISAPTDTSSTIHKVAYVTSQNIGAEANAIVTNGKVTGVTVTNGGFGYTSPPSVIIASPATGTTATAYATVANGQVTGIILSGNTQEQIGGSGYTQSPQVIISGPQASDVVTAIGLTAPIGSRPFTGSIIKIAGAITGFNVTNPGYGYSKPFFSNFENANAFNIVLANTVGISSTVNNGMGGTEPIAPSGLNFKVTTKRNEAELLPIINANGEIEAVQISKPGLGYTYAIVDVETSIDPDNDGVVQGEPEFEKASILLNFGIGDIESRQSTVELTAIPGAIHVIKVDNPGFGYTSPPAITVVGDGVGCTATATLTLTGSLDKIQVTNIGYGYTKASVVITGNSSTAATARAVISPKGGHGKDAVSELYSKTVVFHSNLSKEKNQGFISTNDYRQLCIVKNPKLFDKDTNLRLALASSCFTVIGSAGQAGFNAINQDDILTWTDTLVTPNRSYTFRVVEKNATYSDTQSALLLSYLDNKIPPSGATFSKVGAAFSTTGLTLPDVNKFSGDLLTIDNRLKFSPSTQQIVVVTNSITF